MSAFLDPRFAVTVAAVALFAWAFANNPADQTLIGAMIGAFNMAIGYWIGSSSSSDRKTELMAGHDPKPVEVVNTPGNPVPTDPVPPEYPTPAFPKETDR